MIAAATGDEFLEFLEERSLQNYVNKSVITWRKSL
jgi:hypothetical protein